MNLVSQAVWRYMAVAFVLLSVSCGYAGETNAPLFNPLADTNCPATVLVFVSNDCPLANRYVPELHRLQKAFASRGVKFWLVHSDPEETPAEIRKHTEEFKITLPEICDPNQSLAKLARATVTPTAAIFIHGKELIYHGRIDNRAISLGHERAEPTRREVVDVLEAVLDGKPVPYDHTKAIGCHIPGMH